MESVVWMGKKSTIMNTSLPRKWLICNDYLNRQIPSTHEFPVYEAPSTNNCTNANIIRKCANVHHDAITIKWVCIFTITANKCKEQININSENSVLLKFLIVVQRWKFSCYDWFFDENKKL